MNQKYSPHVLAAFVTLFAIVACVLPGQTAQPAPDIDLIAIETAVAGTAQAAATQTAALAQPIPTHRTGTILEQFEDGSTLYIDYDAGFEVTYPTGWLALRPNSEEFNAALAKEGGVNLMLLEQMKLDQAYYDEADLDRLYVYILRPDIEKNVIFGNSKLFWDPQDSTSIDSVTMEKSVQRLESSEGLQGFHADTAKIRENSNGVQMIEVGGRWTKSNEEETIPAYAKVVLFKPSPSSMTLLLFKFPEYYQVQFSTDVNFVMESIRLIEP